MRRFLVVTPTFQSEAYLDECIHSIVAQAGEYDVRYHIQDGGSTDGTWDIVQRWRKALVDNPRLFPCRVTLTAEQAPDGGMYDAIMKAFAHLRPKAGDVMTWLNSDDLLAPGAFKAVAGCMAENKTVSLCGGRTALINAETRLDHVSPPMLRSQALMAAGLYDGRKLPFIMQEGTFWTGRLWKAVGGLDRTFRLAGDWDLWRRMAEHAPYIALDALTGFHRRRPGQLSGDIDAYHREVDRALTGPPGERYERLYKEYLRINPDSLNFDNSAFPGLVGVVEGEERIWRLREVYGEPLPPPITVSATSRSLVQRGEVVKGSRGAEGPYPDQDLPSGVRWINAPEALLHLPTAEAGRLKVRLTCRSGDLPSRVELDSGGETLLSTAVFPQTPDRNQILTFDFWASPGENPLRLTTHVSEGNPELRLLIVDLTYELMVPTRSEQILSAHGPAVVVVASAQRQGLWQTLTSLGAQSRRPSSIIVITDGDGDVLRDVVDVFDGVTLVTCPPDQMALKAVETLGQSDAAFGLRLAAGQILEPKALEAALDAIATRSVDAIFGATLEIDDQQNAYRRFRDDRDLPWVGSRAVWRSLIDTPSIVENGWSNICARLAQAGRTAQRAPVTFDVLRGLPSGNRPSLRILWFTVEADEFSESFGSALAALGADVRCVILPANSGRASKSANFHYEAWSPAMTFASPRALECLGGKIGQLPILTRDAELAAQVSAVGAQSDGPGGLLELALELGIRAGEIGGFWIADDAQPKLRGPQVEPVQDRFGGCAYGFVATGAVDLAKAWTAREGFGRGMAPTFASDLPASFRWIEERRAEMGVYSASAGLRRLVIWLRSPVKNQRLIIRCGGRLVHECAVGGTSMKQDQRIAVSVEMVAGWNDIGLEFSSVLARAGQTLAAIVTGVDVKSARPHPVSATGDWSYVDGADYEEPPHPHFGLHTPFRWSLNPCVLRLTPSVAGPSLVTIRYQTAVPRQGLTVTFNGSVIGKAYAEEVDISVIRTLSFEVDLAATGSDVRIEADRLMQDGRSLSFIIDEVTISPRGNTRIPSRVLTDVVASSRQFLRRIVRAVRVRLRS